MVASMKTHQGSGNLHSLVAANALTYLQPGSSAKAGQTIDVILL
jgi:molybdopterin biosynthesis enzyme